jgi:hypothetical protein
VDPKFIDILRLSLDFFYSSDFDSCQTVNQNPQNHCTDGAPIHKQSTHLEKLGLASGSLQTGRYRLLLALLHMAKFHRTPAIVRPKRTLLVQIHLVEPEIVVRQQALQPRIDLHIVVVVHRVHITVAVVDGTLKLQGKGKKPWSCPLSTNRPPKRVSGHYNISLCNRDCNMHFKRLILIKIKFMAFGFFRICFHIAKQTR